MATLVTPTVNYWLSVSSYLLRANTANDIIWTACSVPKGGEQNKHVSWSHVQKTEDANILSNNSAKEVSAESVEVKPVKPVKPV